MWKYYRFDFSSSSGADNRAPDGSFEWDMGTGTWRRRGRADAPLILTDVSGNIFVQIDTASTELGSNATTNADVNFAAVAVDMASTGTLGGRFDNSSSGYFHEEKTIPDALIKSFTMSVGPPAMRLRYDNNTTLAGFCNVFISFNSEYGK